MALWSLINGTDLWSSAVTKINNAINSYNGFNGGLLGQRLAKADTATDFYVEWCDPETKINTTTSVNLDTILVGDTVELTLLYHTYTTHGNTSIKAFSSASGLNYIVGTVTATSVTTVTIQVYEKGGSGTHTDMVAIPYGSDYNQKSYYLAGAYPNEIFITAPALTGATFDYHNISWVRNGNMATVSGEFHFIATGIIINDTIDMAFQTDRWIKNGTALDLMGTASVIRVNGSNYTSHPALCSNYSVENGLTITVLPLTTVVADNVILQFTFSYIIA